MADKTDTVPVNLKVDRVLHERFKACAKHNDSDASKEIRKFMREYVAKHSNLALKL